LADCSDFLFPPCYRCLIDTNEPNSLARRHPGFSRFHVFSITFTYSNGTSLVKLADLVKHYWKDKAWDYARLNQYPDQALTDEIFQIPVNMSKVLAIALIQRSFKVLNCRALYYFDHKVDRVAGSKKLSASWLLMPLKVIPSPSLLQ